jgi:alpha-ribazole phosphatase
MKVIFVRHGLTDHNVAKQYLGHYDAGLNSSGREQINCLVPSLKKVGKIHAIYCSDLLRTFESSTIIGEALGLCPITEIALRELHFGDWDLCTFHEIWERQQREVEKWMNDPFAVAPPNGETLTQLGERFDSWMNDFLLKKHFSDNVLIVGHGGPIRWFQSKWLLNDKKQFWKVESINHGEGFIAALNHDRKFIFQEKL